MVFVLGTSLTLFYPGSGKTLLPKTEPWHIYSLVLAYFDNGCALFDDFDVFLMKNHYKTKSFCENLGVIFFVYK